MILPPPLYTYKSDDAPDNKRWLARWADLPVMFYGRTKEGVVASADAFWAGEQAKEAAKKKLATDRSERMRARGVA